MGVWAVSAEADSDTRVGAVIAGRFRIERSLGSGGMADVFAANDLATRRSVAVKLLKKDIAANAEATERLRREGEVLKKLDHPAIVRLETFGKLEDGRLFIAMELLGGETLGERMRRKGRLDPGELASIVSGACSGLAAAHEAGIVHRDLKPDNVFLADGPDGTQVKLLDFGISKVTGSDKLTQTGEVLGTPRYMAPEQLSAERDLDGRTDVYAFGVILYEALAGSPPFLASTPTDLIVAILHGKSAPLRSFRPDLGTDVEAVVTRAMARAREARYASATELSDAWVAVVQPAARASLPGAPAGAREGMTTAPMGSVGEVSGEHPTDVVTPAADRGAGPAAEDLRPGTFSALAASPAAVPAPIAPVAAAAGEELRTAAAKATPSPEPRHRQPADPHPGPPASSRRRTPTVPYKLPTKGARTWLIVGAAVAGAISAAIAIVALKLASDDDGASEAPAQVQPAVGVSGVAPPAQADARPGAADAIGPASERAEGDDGLPEGVEPPAHDTDEAATEERPEPTSSEPRAKRARERRPAGSTLPSGGSGGTAPAADPTPRSAADLMRDARAALRDGDPRACVTLVERAIEAGASSSALRLRGDCLVRAGDREAGLRAYERFCLLAPDHPAIGEVRALVESLGGRCN